jgi:hypothetical protein
MKILKNDFSNTPSPSVYLEEEYNIGNYDK